MANRSMPSIPAPQRVVRVFVSSTFRDMQAERDILVKEIFPKLRNICAERGIALIDIDLRWGIPDEETAEAKVLSVCLDEIERCRPFFVGLLGQRYGYVPEGIPAELIQSHRWLAHNLEKSITELEIVHGALRNPAMANRAFFYFRDPKYVQLLPEKQQADFVEQNRAQCVKIEALKKAIKDSELPTRENYPDPETLGRLVFEDLLQAIDQEYPPGPPANILDQQAAEHNAFASSHMRTYVQNENWFGQLDRYVADGGEPLVVIDAEGMGKSALLANWSSQYQGSEGGRPVISHYLEAGSQGTQLHLLVLRLTAELIRCCELDEDVPVTRDLIASQKAFRTILQKASDEGGVILILDGLDRLETPAGRPHLEWLPNTVPCHVRLIASASPGILSDDLIARGWQTLSLEHLGRQNRVELARRYLAQYSKALSPVQLDNVTSGGLSGNPLFLRSVLAELRIFGVHERLDDLIHHYLASETITGLFEKIYQRWEDDYNRGHPNLVREVLKLLWASRRGLSEVEIAQALASGTEFFPQAYLSPFFLASEHVLKRSSGTIHGSRAPLLRVSGRSSREALRRKYLATRASQQSAHLRVADVFRDQVNTYRRLDEVPWQYAAANDLKSLCEFLSHLPNLKAAWQISRSDTRNYWKGIETNSALRLCETYAEVLASPQESDEDSVAVVAALMTDLGPFDHAAKLHLYLADNYRRSGNRPALRKGLGMQGVALWRSGKHREAVAVYREQEMLCREDGDKTTLADCLGNLGNVLHAEGNLRDAMAFHIEEQRLCEELGDRKGMQASLGNQAILLHDLGDMQGAMSRAKQQERIGHEIGSDEAVARALGHQARVMLDTGELDDALELRKREEAICRALGDQIGLSTCLGNQALICSSLGDLDAALALHKEEEALCRRVGHKRGLQVSLGNQAIILSRRGSIAEAESLFAEQEKLCLESGDPRGLMHCLLNRAVLLTQQMGQAEKALPLAERAKELAVRHGFAAAIPQIGSVLELIRSRFP